MKIYCLTSALSHGVTVIKFDDNGLVALNKPPGLMSHPNNEKATTTALLTACYDHKLKKYSLKNDVDFFLLNRLDSPTSGVIIGCFDEMLAEAVINSFSMNQVQKKYIALTKFYTCKKQGIWEDFLTKTLANDTIRMRQSRGEKCITGYKILEIINTRGLILALLELNPITGKTHQLRAQCAIHNMPIIGDKTYGDFHLNKEFLHRFNQNRMFLHSESINLTYSLRNTKFNLLAINDCGFKNIVNIKLI